MNRRRAPSGRTSRTAREATAPVAVLLSRDRALVEHVTALAEAAGTSLEVVAAAASIPRATRLVIIGLDAAADVPAGRSGGVLVVRVEGADPPDGVWRQAVQLGVERVVVLPEGEPWLVERLLDAAGPDERAPVVGVVGGCGGAGASSLAICLAVTAATSRLRPVLVDVDPLGGGLDLPFGVEQVPGMRWPDLPWSAGRLPAGVIGSALPEIRGVRVLACPRGEVATLAADAVTAALDAAARESDLVVVDLPRRIGEVEAAVLSRCLRVLLVVPAQIRAVAAAAQVAGVLEAVAADVRVVVREPLDRSLAPESVAEALILPLGGSFRTDAAIGGILDAGEAAVIDRRGPLAAVSRQIIADVLEQA